MSVHTDSSGRIIGFAYHDALLNCVEIATTDTAELSIQRDDGSLLHVSLLGLKKFSLTDFLEGNIVDTMYAWSAEAVPERVVQGAAAAFHLQMKDVTKLSGAQACQWFLLECSYGASIYALCDHIKITEV